MDNRSFLRTAPRSVRTKRRKGFSLVSVLLTGTLAMAWLAASSMTLLPMFRYVGNSASVVRLETASESAAEYALALLNDQNTKLIVDPEANGVQTQNVIIPTPLINQLLPGGSLSATITRTAPPDANYDPASSNSYGLGAQKASALSGVSLPWRTIVATASLGTITRKVIVVLRPSALGPKLFGRANGSKSFFPQSGFNGVDMIWLGTGSTTGAKTDITSSTPLKGDLGKNIGGDIATYGTVRLDGNANVGGRLQVISDGTSKGAAQAVGNSVEVSQYLQLTSSPSLSPSTQTGFVESGQPNANVINDGDAASSDTSLIPTGNTRDEILSGSSNPINPSGVSPGVAPAYSASQGAQPHSPSYGFGDKIAGGDYSVQSLNISSGTVTTASDGSPARIFVEGNSSEAVQITGDINATGAPENVQIWYNGTGNVTFSSTSTLNVSAVIYAPNANVIFKSNQPVNFTGAITAKTISGGVDENGVPTSGARNVNLTFIRNMQNANSAPQGSSLASLTYNSSDFSYDSPSLKWVVDSVYANPKEHY